MKIFEITGGGAKSVIDFVGAAPAFEFAYGLFGLVRGGTYVLVGLLGGQTTLQLPLVTLTARTLTGTYVGSLAEMGELMDLVRSGRLILCLLKQEMFQKLIKLLKTLRVALLMV